MYVVTLLKGVNCIERTDFSFRSAAGPAEQSYAPYGLQFCTQDRPMQYFTPVFPSVCGLIQQMDSSLQPQESVVTIKPDLPAK